MAVPMVSTDFRSIVEPILSDAFDGLYDQRADEWRQVFKEQTNVPPRAYLEEPVLYGFGVAPQVPEGTAFTYDAGGVLYIQRFLYAVYGLAFSLTKVLIEDGDHIQIGTTYAKHLAQSMIETKETLCANVLNRAFNGSYPGGDGVSLVSASHPIIGGTASNQLTTPAVLSQTSLEQMLIQVRQAVDSRGKKIRLNPTSLVVSPSNVFQAEVLLKSVLRAGSANNDINPVKSMGLLSKGQANLSRLTSTTAWWVQNQVEDGLKLVMRRRLERTSEPSFETDSMRYKSSERYTVGWTDWRTVYGTAGV
jgi:hypothetical protein